MVKKTPSESLSKFKAARAKPVLSLLIQELARCKKRKRKFRSIGLLAEFLSSRVLAHRTTLLRNKKYKKLLMSYFCISPDQLLHVSDTTTDPAILQAKLAAAHLTASNLAVQNKHLVAQLGRYLDPSSKPGASKDDLDIANCAMLLVAVLERVDFHIRIDYEGRRVIDKSAKPSEQLVADSRRAGPFIAWLEQNESLPAIRKLRNQDE
jgi:hypothetical protein